MAGTHSDFPGEATFFTMTIAIDLDEVLAYSLQCEIDWHNHTHGTNLIREDYHDLNYMKVWNCTREEAVKRVLTYLQTDFFRNIEPFQGAIAGVNYLSGIDRLVIVTSRTDEVRRQTEDWLDLYFPNKFAEVHFCNLFSGIGKKPVKKFKKCQDLGAHTIIDDSPNFTLECAQNGIRAILFDHLWNRKVKLIENMERAYGWLGNERKKGIISLIK